MIWILRMMVLTSKGSSASMQKAPIPIIQIFVEVSGSLSWTEALLSSFCSSFVQRLPGNMVQRANIFIAGVAREEIQQIFGCCTGSDNNVTEKLAQAFDATENETEEAAHSTFQSKRQYLESKDGELGLELILDMAQ
jgi:hypothetical protein